MQRVRTFLDRLSCSDTAWTIGTLTLFGTIYGAGVTYRDYLKGSGMVIQGLVLDGRVRIRGGGEDLKMTMRAVEGVMGTGDVAVCTATKDVATGETLLEIGVPHGEQTDLPSALLSDLALYIRSPDGITLNTSKSTPFQFTGLNASCLTTTPTSDLSLPTLASNYLIHGSRPALAKLKLQFPEGDNRRVSYVDKQSLVAVGMCVLAHGTDEVQFSSDHGVRCVTRRNVFDETPDETPYTKGYHVFKLGTQLSSTTNAG
eukprot:TRINITY_DN47353_c0_g1_i1.p1 TRINITY_DN47353_c0_g1~~TRINITY_DN47353_c0_g1_i1.p1  ORF type:complete len:282 (+),score=26.08 TRINITY_DN47353_c0_g1_i1:74-847(+)